MVVVAGSVAKTYLEDIYREEIYRGVEEGRKRVRKRKCVLERQIKKQRPRQRQSD